MTKNNRMSAFFSYFFCVVAYFGILNANSTFLDSVGSSYEVSFNEYDQIEYYKILGYVSASIFLLLFSRFFSLKVFIVLGTILYLISILAISSGDVSSESNFLYFSLYSASYLMVGSVIFLYIFCGSQIGSEITLISISFASITSFFINELKLFVVTLDGLAGLIITNIIWLGIFTLINFSYSIFKKKIRTSDYNFSGVVRNIELEVMCGFCLLYIFMVVSDGYDVYSITDHLFTIVESNIRYYVMILIVLLTSLLMLYINKLNIHVVNIFSIGLLFILFISMPYWAVYKVVGIIGWFTLSSLCLTTILCNILVIARKFDEINLVTAFLLYLLGCCGGYYCGYITLDTSENTLGENGFLVSIWFVLFSLLVYYVYLFRKYKLSQ